MLALIPPMSSVSKSNRKTGHARCPPRCCRNLSPSLPFLRRLPAGPTAARLGSRGLTLSPQLVDPVLLLNELEGKVSGLSSQVQQLLDLLRALLGKGEKEGESGGARVGGRRYACPGSPGKETAERDSRRPQHSKRKEIPHRGPAW